MNHIACIFFFKANSLFSHAVLCTHNIPYQGKVRLVMEIIFKNGRMLLCVGLRSINKCEAETTLLSVLIRCATGKAPNFSTKSQNSSSDRLRLIRYI